MTSTDTLYRLSWNLYGDTRAAALEQLSEVRLPKRLPIKLAHLAIMRRETFDAGNMHASHLRGRWSSPDGRLPYTWENTFHRDLESGAYVIYSYGTPIAWERADGLRVIPRVSYSISTSRHQSQVRRAWDMGWSTEYSHPTRSMASL